MELVKEYSAVSCFPPELSTSCFFHIQQEYCCLSSSEKTLYKSNGQDMEILKLAREYPKLLYCEDSSEYLAYSNTNQKNEIALYRLDSYLKEFDVQNLKKDGTAAVQDIWLDARQKVLYIVFSQSIQKYNLNGDYLGFVMKAPADTWYKAVCSKDTSLFVAYERKGCAYVAEYDLCGIYKNKYNIGGNFFVGNMEIVHGDTAFILCLYGKRPDQIAVCLELSLDTKDCKNKKIDKDGKGELCVEVSKGDGVGGTTCYFSCPGE